MILTASCVSTQARPAYRSHMKPEASEATDEGALSRDDEVVKVADVVGSNDAGAHPHTAGFSLCYNFSIVFKSISAFPRSIPQWHHLLSLVGPLF